MVLGYLDFFFKHVGQVHVLSVLLQPGLFFLYCSSACGSLAVLLSTHMANRILTLYTLIAAMAPFIDLEFTPWLCLTTL